MESIGSAVTAYWHKYATLLLAPVLAAVVSISYFVVRSEDFLTVQSAEIPNKTALPEIVSGQKYVQEIHGERNGLERISLQLATYARTNQSNVSISLSDSQGNIIREWTLKSSILKDNTYRTLEIGRRLKNSNGQTYYLTLTSDASPGNGITVWTGESGKGLFLNGKALGKTFCYRLGYRAAHSNLFSRANGFHVMVLFVLAYIIFTLLPHLSRIRIEHSFLTVWIFLSLMYAFSATLFSVPDEGAHLSRSYELSYGYLMSDVNEQTGQIGRRLPLDIDLGLIGRNWQSFSDNKGLKISDHKAFRDFHTVAVYSPVTYLPQAIGICFARHLTDNISVIVYSGRFANWLFITLILYASIRIIPVGKEVLALIALMPMNIHECVSLASDGLVVSVSILMISAVIYLRYRQSSRIKVWQYVVLYLLAWIISQLKLVYLPFILVYTLIPDALFGGSKKKWLHLAVIAFLAVVSNLVWLKLCGKFLIHNGSDFGANLGFILHHPINYLVTLARTFLNGSSLMLETMVGSLLAWLNVQVPGVLIQFYLCILGYHFWVSRRKAAGNELISALVFGFIVVSIVLLIATSEYLYWTQPFANSVKGIQGRYLIPLLLPLYFAISNPSGLLESKNQQVNLSVNTSSFVTCINFCACTALLFYCIAL